MNLKKQLSIFITAGYPELNSLPEQLEFLEQKGIDFVEVGMPFSDPMADGEVIQKSSEIALKNGMNLDLLFKQLQQRKSTIPIVLMGYFNPVIKYGLQRFLEKCSELGIQKVILPDLSPEIYERFYQLDFETHCVYPVFIVSPLTEDMRVKKIAEQSKNSFVYLVSSNSITGQAFSTENENQYTRIRDLCQQTPVYMGFGIKQKKDIEFAYQFCDGAIIGSAYLKALEKGKQNDFLSLIL